ncbi:cytochrome C oxidase subunit IV family protein [Quatrionicoccus australiensis]|uniref:cytochrome C oxidase subunit IV family protein n=1 Tax=Quatrionicoccus australiensis TaxID=138118 RepID=UPI001CF9C698|nr:cytochrome C oxidase subunit IV family protein [Quatrionicoccus australiensis]MCB4361780.1 cytochrome C oxidase subunit IV family protein [Quatrionicoccus australiensis]
MNTNLRTDAVWLVLLLGTAATWWLGENGQTGTSTVQAILAIAGVKGVLVIREFMALRGVRPAWQGAVIGWLLLVLLVNMAVYWKGI